MTALSGWTRPRENGSVAADVYPAVGACWPRAYRAQPDQSGAEESSRVPPTGLGRAFRLRELCNSHRAMRESCSGIWVMPRSEIDIDRELDGMRRVDAAVLSRLFLPPDSPGRMRWLSFHVLVHSFGVRGAMRRLARRGYIERGWKLTHADGATFQVTELGSRVAPAAALAIEADAMDDDGTVQAFWWLRGRIRFR